jgi:large subunit ribosomal protein L23
MTKKTNSTEQTKKWEEFYGPTGPELNKMNLMNTNNSSINTIDLVKYPVITEKTYVSLYKNRQYTFDVDKRLNKTQIKKLFENLFKVNIIAVNTHIPPRHRLRVGMAQGYRPTYKRAIITLKEGQSINFNILEAKPQ